MKKVNKNVSVSDVFFRAEIYIDGNPARALRYFENQTIGGDKFDITVGSVFADSDTGLLDVEGTMKGSFVGSFDKIVNEVVALLEKQLKNIWKGKHGIKYVRVSVEVKDEKNKKISDMQGDGIEINPKNSVTEFDGSNTSDEIEWKNFIDGLDIALNTYVRHREGVLKVVGHNLDWRGSSGQMELPANISPIDLIQKITPRTDTDYKVKYSKSMLQIIMYTHDTPTGAVIDFTFKPSRSKKSNKVKSETSDKFLNFSLMLDLIEYTEYDILKLVRKLRNKYVTVIVSKIKDKDDSYVIYGKYASNIAGQYKDSVQNAVVNLIKTTLEENIPYKVSLYNFRILRNDEVKRNPSHYPENLAQNPDERGGRLFNNPSHKESAKWGFDNSGIKPNTFVTICKCYGLSITPDLTKTGWAFVGKNLVVYTEYNPINGKYFRQPDMIQSGTIGYAGYIGIEGRPADVHKFVSDFKKNASFIKDESPNEREFI